MRRHLMIMAAAIAAAAVALAPVKSRNTLADPVEFTDGKATYTVTESGDSVVLTGWDAEDTSEDITIPETATDGTVTYEVTGIGNDVFAADTEVKSVTVPASVTSIGDKALAGENLTKVTLLSAAAPTLGTDVFAAGAEVTVPAGSTGYDAEAWEGINVIVAGTDDGNDTTDPADDNGTADPSGTGEETTDPSGEGTTPSGDEGQTPDPSDNEGGTTTPEKTGTVADFVERLYTVALGRPSEPEGKADWINRAENAGYTGADLARGFLFSPEFLDKKLDTSDFLDILYKTFFDREADPEGKADWTNRMANGWTAKDVINGFIGSDEWAALCDSYGIASGRDQLAYEEGADKITAFVARLYSTCLGRNPDPDGLTDWSSQLAAKKITGTEVAHGFFFSPEFLDAHYSDSEYVTRLYRTFLNRAPDTDGFNDWVGRLADGTSREDVFMGFANSVEFGLLCQDYGILR